MSMIVAQGRVLFALVALAALGACGSGSGADNPCGLTPTGTVTDGDFSGTMKFEGVAQTFPLHVHLDATARALAGDVSFDDARESYDGTFSATITADGAISGSYNGVGASTGSRISGTVSGVTDNQTVCGTWKNTADQSGTWQLTRD